MNRARLRLLGEIAAAKLCRGFIEFVDKPAVRPLPRDRLVEQLRPRAVAQARNQAHFDRYAVRPCR
jgi:hypothetical protein